MTARRRLAAWWRRTVRSAPGGLGGDARPCAAGAGGERAGEKFHSGGRVLKMSRDWTSRKLLGGGAMARWRVLTEITLKVCPRRNDGASLVLPEADPGRGVALSAGAGSPYGVSAAAYLPARRPTRVPNSPAGRGRGVARIEDFAAAASLIASSAWRRAGRAAFSSRRPAKRRGGASRGSAAHRAGQTGRVSGRAVRRGPRCGREPWPPGSGLGRRRWFGRPGAPGPAMRAVAAAARAGQAPGPCSARRKGMRAAVDGHPPEPAPLASHHPPRQGGVRSARQRSIGGRNTSGLVGDHEKPDFTHDSSATPIAASNQVLRTCVHCGFCTATCPTFVLLGDELDSPRGRIYLIKDMLESGRPATAEVVRHVDRCLPAWPA